MAISIETLALARKYTDKAVSSATGIEFKIVQTLPSVGVAGGIYLVSNGYGRNANIYDEYIYVNNGWEKIGSTEVDLTQYRTSSAQDLIDDAQNTAINERLQSNQGIANAGKFMVVGSDGVVVPVTMQVWQGGSY